MVAIFTEYYDHCRRSYTILHQGQGEIDENLFLIVRDKD